MTRVENKYEACPLDKENTWGQLSDDHEKIIEMSAEIDLLKKNHHTNITPKATGKDRKRSATAPLATKTKDEGK